LRKSRGPKKETKRDWSWQRRSQGFECLTFCESRVGGFHGRMCRLIEALQVIGQKQHIDKIEGYDALGWDTFQSVFVASRGLGGVGQ